MGQMGQIQGHRNSLFLSTSVPPTDPIDAIEYLTKALSSAADVAVPTSIPRKKNAPWNNEIKRCIIESKHADSLWKNSGKPPPPNKLFISRKLAKKQLRQAQRLENSSQRAKELQEIHEACESNSNLLFRLIKDQRKRETTNSTTDKLIIDNTTFQGDVWHEHFSKLAKPSSNPNFNDTRQLSAEYNVNLISANVKNAQLPFKVIKHEVTVAISGLKRKKASDIQNLAAEHLQVCPQIISTFLTPVLNQIINTGHIPNILKEGIVHPVHKKGKSNVDPGNYRGITVSPILAKLLDTIALTHQRIATPDRLNDLQYGFTEGCSDLFAAFLLQESIADAKDKGVPLYVLSVDVQKAFDVLRHASLLDKEYHLGLDGTWWRLKHDSYKNISGKVKWRNDLSEGFNLEQGNRQGGLSSPDDYLSYIVELLSMLENTGQDWGY